MATSLEMCFHKGMEHGFCYGHRYETGRNAEYISIIMLANQLSHLFLPAERGPNALVLVGRYGYAIGGAADEHTPGSFSTFYGIGYWVGKVGVVYRIEAVGTEVLYLKALAAQQVGQEGFVFKAGMVGTYSYRTLQHCIVFHDH